MDEKELSKAISEGVSKAINAKVESFYVEREQHWDDHKFITRFRRWYDDTTSIVSKAVVTAIVVGFITLIVIGFKIWGKH